MRRAGLWLLVLVAPVTVGLVGFAARRALEAESPWPTPQTALPLTHDGARPLALPRRAPPLDYALEAQLVPDEQRVDGSLRLRFSNTSQRPLSELRLHLYLNAFSGPKTRFMKSSHGVHRGHAAGQRGRITVSGVRVGGRTTTSKKLHDGTVLKVDVSPPAPPGSAIELRLRFTSMLPRIFARTGHAGDFFMVAQWYPKLGKLRADGTWHCPPFHANEEFFADFARYRLRLSLPARFRVGHSGGRVATRTIGDQRQLEIEARWVHDLAFVAWPHFVEHRQRVDGVAVRLLGVPGRDNSRRLLDLTRFGLRRLGRWFGAYPYRQLTVVDVPTRARGAGAMEYPTLFTVWVPLGVPAGVHSADEVVLHELTHQYLQGIVATNEVAEPWLDEGLTTTVTALLLEARFGPRASFLHLPWLSLGQRDKNQLHQAIQTPPQPIAKAAAAYPSWRGYGATVYGRTGALFHTLSGLLGQRRVLAALRAYVQKGAFAHPRRRDLISALRAQLEAAERPLIDTLLEGILDRGATLDYALACEKDRVIVRRRGTLALPLVVRWHDTAGAVHSAQVSGKAKLQAVFAPGLTDAELGPPARLTLDPTPLDRRCSRRGGGSWGAALSGLSAWQSLVQAVTP